MSKEHNIEELFKEAFDGFEADVDPGVWSNIQNQISGNAPSGQGQSASSGGASGGAGAAGLTKIIAAVALVGAVGYGIYEFVIKDKRQDKLVEQKVEELVEDMLSEEVTPDDAVEMTQEKLEIVGETPKEEQQTESTPVADRQNTERSEEQDQEDNADVDNNRPHNPMLAPSNTEPVVQVVDEQKPKQENKQTEAKSNTGNTGEAPANTDDNVTPEIPAITENPIIPSKVEGTVPLTVTFESEYPANSYKWRFDDGTESTMPAPMHEFDKAGEYVVELEWTDQNQEVRKSTKTIVVRAKSSVNLPNVFSPNGDGSNDRYIVATVNIKQISGKIVSKNSGRTVFQWNEVGASWDGTDMSSGEALPMGVYFCVVKAVGEDGKMHTEKQVIQLKR